MEEKCLAPSAYEAQRSRGTYKKQLDNQLHVQKIFSRQEEPITSNWSEL